ALLSALLTRVRAVSLAIAREGRGAPLRARRPSAPSRGRAPSPVAARARARLLPLPSPPALGLHGTRPPAAAHRAPHGALATALRALRPDRRAQRERQGHTRRPRRRARAASRHPP